MMKYFKIITTILLLFILASYGMVLAQAIKDDHIKSNNVESKQSEKSFDSFIDNFTSKKKPKVDKKEKEAFPEVVLEKKQLFPIKTSLESLSTVDRADIISRKIKKLATNKSFDPNTISLKRFRDSIFISTKDIVIMSITESDAIAEKISQDELAERYLEKIKKSIKSFKKRKASQNIKTWSIKIFCAVIVLALVFLLLQFIFAQIAKAIKKLENKKFKSVYIQNFKVISAEQIASIVVFVTKFVKIIFVLILFYFFTTYVFSLFPQTSTFADNLIAYLLSSLLFIGQNILSYLPNLILMMIIIYIFYNLIKFVDMFFNAIKSGSIKFSWFHKEWTDTTRTLVKFFLIIVCFALMYEYIPGSGSFVFKSISIILGFAVTIGSSGLMTNIVSGIILTYTRSFDIGERIKIGKNYGDIYERNILVTRIKTIKNEIISIPNSIMLASEIINYSKLAKTSGLVISSEVTIGYDIDQSVVEALLIESALKTPDILQDQPPFVFKKALNDFYITYELNAYTDKPRQMAVIHSELNNTIINEFKTKGVEIMSPHYYAIRDGNNKCLPE